jgi:hypothetical protein
MTWKNVAIITARVVLLATSMGLASHAHPFLGVGLGYMTGVIFSRLNRLPFEVDS